MQIPDLPLRENRNQRLPLVLGLDLSTSMLDRASGSGQAKIDLLIEGRRRFAAALHADEQAALKIQVAELGFGLRDQVWIETEVCDAAAYDPQPLTANGTTPLGATLMFALAYIAQITKAYREHGIGHWVPVLVVITDGQSTDDWRAAAAAAREAEARRDVIIFPVGVGEHANLELLAEFSRKNAPQRIEAVEFGAFFVWLSRSLSIASRSRPGEQIDLRFDQARGT